jgi:hypothetical protein
MAQRVLRLHRAEVWDVRSGICGLWNCGEALKFGCEWRLRSVLELGYDVFGSPPTGELLVRTPTMASGYFEEDDSQVLLRKGFFALVTLCPFARVESYRC